MGGRVSVSYEVEAGVAVVTFDRPEVLNAFDDDMGRAALEAVTKASKDAGVRCIVITGAGRAFSAGEDLAALTEGYERGDPPPLGDILRDRYNPLIRAITGAPKPVVAAVNGVAAGAGASVALACDHRVAVEGAKFILAFIKVGLVPDSGAIWFLQRAIGSAKTWHLASTGEPLSAQGAAALGLVDVVASPDDFEESWRAFAHDLAAGPTKAYALTKALLRRSGELSLDEQLEAEIDAQTEAGASADHMEGVTAFFAKRPPSFEGR